MLGRAAAMDDTNSEAAAPAETGQQAAPRLEIDLSQTVKTLSERVLPLEVGAFEVGEDGAVRPRPNGAPLSLAFRYRGIAFEAHIETAGEPRLQLSAYLGHLPFTAEAPWNRYFVSRLIAKAGRLPRARIVLREGNEICIDADMAPPEPRTPAAIMATIAALLLEMRPYIEVLQAALPRAEAAKAAPL